MNADVEKAVAVLDGSLHTWGADVEFAWQDIRQALRDQEAEIARLSGINVRLCADFNAQNLHGATLDGRVRKAETRAEKAEALLREAIEWNWLDDDSPTQTGVREGYESVMDALYRRITAHLGAEQ